MMVMEWIEEKMKQVHDFLAECQLLSSVIEPIGARDFERVTQFKGWTIEDVLTHLYFWNVQADHSIFAPDLFAKTLSEILPAIQSHGMRPVENARISPRGFQLYQAWNDHFHDFCSRLNGIDPKLRVKWAGPDMSVRSSITARQMETWAHGHEVFDCLGQQRHEGDRIENIVILGVNTFGWSHSVQGLDIPQQIPHLKLTSPSGEIWEFGNPSDPERIEGTAVAFAQVVTQTRSVFDTDLQITGSGAQLWMETAQCFAGGKEAPPRKGARFVQGH